MVVADGTPLSIVVDLHAALPGGGAPLQAHGIVIGGCGRAEDAGVEAVAAALCRLTPLGVLALEDGVLCAIAIDVAQPDLPGGGEGVWSGRWDLDYHI